MSTCITVVCDMTYQRYLPLFVRFASSSYPAYGIQVFMQGKLGNVTRNAIKRVDSKKAEIHENFISEDIRNKQALKTFRWLLDEELFDGFDNVYIGDIDLLICSEKQSIEDVHVKHAEANRLPYSNCVRPGTTRLSGLHFYRKVPYYQKMRPLIGKYRDYLLANTIDFTSTRNENILYKMIVESGLDLPRDENRIDINGSGPHHGLHLGIWRKTDHPSEAVIDQIMRDRYMQHYAFFQAMDRRRLLSGHAYWLPEVENMKNFFSALQRIC